MFVITTIIKCVLFIVIRITRENGWITHSPILSIIHTIIIDTILNFSSGKNEQGLKNVKRKQTLIFCTCTAVRIYENKGWVLCKSSVYICTHFIQNVFVDIGCKYFSYVDIDAAVEFLYFSRFSRFNFTVIF